MFSGRCYPKFADTRPYYEIGPSMRTLWRQIGSLPLYEKCTANLGFFELWVTSMDHPLRSGRGFEVNVTEKCLYVCGPDAWTASPDDALRLIWEAAWRFYWAPDGFRLENPTKEPIYEHSHTERCGLSYGVVGEGQEFDLSCRLRRAHRAHITYRRREIL